MPKEDNNGVAGFDVQVIPVATGAASGQLNIPSPSQIGNGVAVIPLPQLAQISPIQQQAAPQGPAVILITMNGKKDEEEEERRRKEKEQEKAEKAKREKEKKTSSVFHRL